MNNLVRAVLLTGCIALFSIPADTSGQSRQAPEEFIKQALKTVGELKIGDTRANLERYFRSDGGMQYSKPERYVYKKCPFIKIDVEFSLKRGNSWPTLSPEDTLISVSKPYLEYPFYD